MSDRVSTDSVCALMSELSRTRVRRDTLSETHPHDFRDTGTLQLWKTPSRLLFDGVLGSWDARVTGAALDVALCAVDAAPHLRRLIAVCH